GEVNVVPTVVIVIADGHAHAVHLNVEPGMRRDVGERSVAVVVVELHGGALGFVAGKILAIYQQDVGIAVIVVVNEGAARSHRFQQVLLSNSARVEVEADSGLAGVAHTTHGAPDGG